MDNKVSVIVFSKGRPMQLHAYLESMLKFSDVKQEDITVLCCEMQGIRYDKVMAKFSQVNWQTEKKFEEDLKKAVSNAGRYIMFGCDDVVFTSDFNLKTASQYLEQNEQVFGFSIRLGQNIVPFPQNAVYKNGIMEWDWEKSNEQHYNYPWELDCTVYRKEDVVRLIDEEEKIIKNPNYLEAIINDDNRNEKITRKHMASNQNRGCAIVITVNRVQDSYQNGFDDSMMTDIYSLDKEYNDENNTLDVEKISQMENKVVHVESEYFILRKASKGYSQNRLLIKKCKNLKKRVSRFPKKCYNYVERRLYRRGIFENKLEITDTQQSMTELLKDKVSFVRIGKDEISLMQGNATPAQQYDEGLADRLKEILKLQESGLKVGIPYYYMYPQKNLNPYIEVHSLSIADRRKFLIKHCSKAIKYFDSCITQAYHVYEEYDFEKHFEMAKKLLADKDITIICGEGVFDRLQYKLIDVCKSVEYQYAPSTEAYSKYDEILKQALKTDKNRIICVALGSTAKPLVYDLYKKGYQVWDIGHLLKDYDCYKKQTSRTETEIIQFYMPD